MGSIPRSMVVILEDDLVDGCKSGNIGHYDVICHYDITVDICIGNYITVGLLHKGYCHTVLWEFVLQRVTALC